MRSSWRRARTGSRKTATQPEPQTEPDDEPEEGPQRRCLVRRECFPREHMLRFVVGPGDALVFDVTATLPGRGLWLSASADVIEKSLKQGVFARAAKRHVAVPPDLALRVGSALRQRVVELCGLARRSGQAVAGFEKAREWLAAGKAALVCQALDGSAEERARFIGGRDVPVATVLSAAELGRIFGREHAVHVVIAPGGLAGKLLNDVLRLAGVAGGNLSGQ